ncbi:MAG: cytidine deaminase [Treponema sp.]|nr:cytidine deaminase [Treponema sp.]
MSVCVVTTALLLAFSSCSKNKQESVTSGAEATNAELSDEQFDNFDRKELIKIAIENQKKSYAPYSTYNVSAALIASSGKIYTGVNVENASYPVGVCAERVAICKAISEGEHGIKAIAIVGGKNYTVQDFCAPCGMCRQAMREFCDPKKMRVVFAKSQGEYKELSLEELLPESFGPDALK